MLMLSIHRKEKDGDWYIYLYCFAHKNHNTAYKNTKGNCKSLKLDKSNAVSVGTTAIKPYLAIRLVGLVWFARYRGKMDSRHLFSYGGLQRAQSINTDLSNWIRIWPEGTIKHQNTIRIQCQWNRITNLHTKKYHYNRVPVGTL